MTVLIRVEGVHKAYGGQVLLDQASAQLTDEHRYGMVGRNGTGKSTLCRMLLGQEEPDSGEIWLSPELRLAYLEQHDPFEPQEPVGDFLQRYSERPDWRCAEVAARFELDNQLLEVPVATLSGGFQTRVKLAGMLLREPNFLLLDEPTNFLDLRTQLLLERFLADWRGGALIVSHDRHLLRAVCDRTVAVTEGALIVHPGPIDDYLQARAEQREHAEKRNASIRAKQQQLQRFIDSNRANANTASQARSKQKQLDRLQTEALPDDEPEVRLAVPGCERRSGSALVAEQLAIGYPDKRVADGIELDIEYGSKVVIVGDNGQGKTTLVRTLCDDLDALDGRLRWGYGCELAVYAQHVYQSIPADDSIQGYLERCAPPGTARQQILDTAGSFLFRGDDVHKSVAVLSGGERARLCLAGLLLAQPSVMLLDEPTNHLDVETIDALAEALRAYQGTVFVVSHDRGFAGRIASHVLRVHEGRVLSVPGSYEDYLYRLRQAISPTPAAAAGADNGRKVSDGRRKHEVGKRIAAAERKLDKLNDERARLQAALATSDVDKALQVDARLREVEAEIEQLEQDWLVMQEEHEAL
ncbi:MAG: ATP-binding cassette domain-containing protein [Planctomycetota bacterium]